MIDSTLSNSLPSGIVDKAYIENPVARVYNNNKYEVELINPLSIASYTFLIKATMRDGALFYTNTLSLTVACPLSVDFYTFG